MKKMNHIIFTLILVIASAASAMAQTTLSGLATSDFLTTVDGQQTGLYVIHNSTGMEACLTNYGARLVTLMAPNWNGRMENVVCGYNSIADYQKNPAVGGIEGFSNRVWQVIRATSRSVAFALDVDGETIIVAYTLTDQNDLDVRFITADPSSLKRMPVSNIRLNISGDFRRSVLTESLWIDSKVAASCRRDGTLTGKPINIRRTALDFFSTRQIVEKMKLDEERLLSDSAYCHVYALRHQGDEREPSAIVYDAPSGRIATIYTTEPALQLITDNDGCYSGLTLLPRNGDISRDDNIDKVDYPDNTSAHRSAIVFNFSTDPPLISNAKGKSSK